MGSELRTLVTIVLERLQHVGKQLAHFISQFCMSGLKRGWRALQSPELLMRSFSIQLAESLVWKLQDDIILWSLNRDCWEARLGCDVYQGVYQWLIQIDNPQGLEGVICRVPQACYCVLKHRIRRLMVSCT